MLYKSFKYRLYPTKSQEIMLNKHLGCARFIYNWALQEKINLYKKNKQKITCFDLIRKITLLKKETDKQWLREVSIQTLQQSIMCLNQAYIRHFKHKQGFPQFKSKHNKHQSYQYASGVKVDKVNHCVKLPKIGLVRAVLHRKFNGKIKTCTVSKAPSGKYFISVLVETLDELPKKPKITKKKSVGVDLGIRHFATLSSGEKIENHKYLKHSLKKISKLQRQHARKKKGSKNREKARLRLAKSYEKITNQRNDFLHKLSTRLIRENQTIIMEDLAVARMLKDCKFSREISDVSWSEFVRQLKYKSEWYGKNLIFIDRFTPSSKTCSCGTINKNLKLSDRKWTCVVCNTDHDRDLLAAQNIKKIGLKNSGTGSAGESVEISVC